MKWILLYIVPLSIYNKLLYIKNIPKRRGRGWLPNIKYGAASHHGAWSSFPPDSGFWYSNQCSCLKQVQYASYPSWGSKWASAWYMTTWSDCCFSCEHAACSFEAFSTLSCQLQFWSMYIPALPWVACIAGVPICFRQDSFGSRTGARKKGERLDPPPPKLFPHPSPTPGWLFPETNGNACNAGYPLGKDQGLWYG